MAVSFPTNKQAIFSRYILLIFGLLALIHLAGILVDSRLLTWSTKPLLMPMLALWFRQITRPSSQYPGMRRLVIAALLFGWVGDVCLMLTGQYSEKLFLAGLGSFLVGQLLYIRAFRLPAALRPGALQTHQWWWGLAAIYLAAFLWMLWPGIPPDFRIPVGLYGACLVGMVTAVFNWKGKIQAAVFFWALGGALFFLLSDSLIGLEKFRFAGQGGMLLRFTVMFTYILGQFGLAIGAASIIRQPAD